MSNKRTLKYAVECKNKSETSKVAGYFKKVNRSYDPWPHFKYVLSHVDGYHSSILYDDIIDISDDYSVISFEEWEELPEDFTLENSTVRGGEELVTYCKENKIENIYGMYSNQQYWVKNNKWGSSSRVVRNIIPLDLYLQLIKETAMPEVTTPLPEPIVKEPTKKILGYKLIKEEYREAASKLAGYDLLSKENQGFDFQSKSPVHLRIETAGVLELWFEPVYEPEFPLPKIGGHRGKVIGDYLVYGCQKVHLSLFGTNNCDLRCINIYGNFVDTSTIEQIRNYLTDNKINFKF